MFYFRTIETFLRIQPLNFKYMRFYSAFILAIALFSSGLLKAQVWFDLGFKAHVGPTGLINTNNWDDRNASPQFSFGNMIGGKAGVYFNMNHGINVEFLSVKYTGATSYNTDNGPLVLEHGFKSFEIPVLYKYHSNEGSYIELGMSFGTINDAIQGGDITFPSADPEDFYIEKYKSVIFGFGGHVFQADNVFGSLGFRFAYTLDDIISENGGQDMLSYYPISHGYTPDPAYTDYKPTNPFSVMLSLEINYDLGYIVSSKCGKRAFITF